MEMARQPVAELLTATGAVPAKPATQAESANTEAPLSTGSTPSHSEMPEPSVATW